MIKRNWVKLGKARKLIYFCVIIDHWCQAFACGVGWGGERLGAAKLCSYKISRFSDFKNYVDQHLVEKGFHNKCQLLFYLQQMKIFHGFKTLRKRLQNSVHRRGFSIKKRIQHTPLRKYDAKISYSFSNI